MRASVGAGRGARGAGVLGMLGVAIVIAVLALLVMRVWPTVNEYWTIQRAVDKAVREGSSAAEVRAAFDRQKQIEYSIQSISGKDLDVRRQGDAMVASFAYDKEIPLVDPVSLLIRYRGRSK